jgi:hypothetical protein
LSEGCLPVWNLKQYEDHTMKGTKSGTVAAFSSVIKVASASVYKDLRVSVTVGCSG